MAVTHCEHVMLATNEGPFIPKSCMRMDVCVLVQLELYYENVDKMDHVKLKHPNSRYT